MKNHLSKYIFLLTLVFSFKCITGQIPDVKWGEKSEVNTMGNFLFLGSDSEYFYVVRFSQGKRFMYKYSTVSGNQLDKIPLAIDQITTKNVFNGSLETKSNIFLYSGALKNKKLSVNICKVEGENITDPENILNHKSETKSGMAWKSINPHFLDGTDYGLDVFSLSQDKRNVLYTNALSKEDKNNENIVVAVFDEAMNLKWQKTVVLKYKDDDLNIRQAILTNDGNIYILASQGEKNDINFKLFRITRDTEEEVKINFGDNLILSTAKLIDVGGAIVMTGLHVDIDKFRTKPFLKGVFYVTYNEDTQNIKFKSENFNDSFYDSLKGDGKIRPQYKMKYIYNFEDNTVGFIAEQYDSYRTQGEHSTTIFTNDYALVVKFSKEGKLVYNTKIEKYTRISDYSLVSCRAVLYEDELYIFYNEHYRSFKEKRRRNKNGTKETLSLAVVTKNGEITYNKDIFKKFHDSHFQNEWFGLEGNKVIFGVRTYKGIVFGMMPLE